MISLKENAGNAGSSLADIEQLTKTFADDYKQVANLLADFEADVEKLKRRYNPLLRAAVGQAGQAKLTLHTAIEQSAALFIKPRTQIFHGVKVGFQKGKGGIEFDDADKVVALIRKNFGKEAIAYIRTVETPDKKMLADLPVSELKKIGCTVGDTGDIVVIKPTDSEIEKAVAALLKDSVESESASK